jgi:hypothetical protein
MKRELTAEALSAAAWIAALEDLPKPVDKVPPGWLTSFEISSQTGIALTTLRRSIAQLKKEGRCETKKFRILRDKNVRPIEHYRLKGV